MRDKNLAVKSILKAVGKRKGLAVVVAVVVAGAVIASLLPPLVLERVVNLLTNGESAPMILIAGYFLLLLLTGVLESAREALLTLFGQKITHSLRSELCGKLSRLPADAFVNTEPGVTVSRFVNDVDTIEDLFDSGIISMFADACQVICIFVILFHKNPGLALVLLILLPFVSWFTRRVQKGMLKAEKENRVAVGKVANHVPETIRCIRTIRTLCRERFMQEKYDRHIEESYAAIEKTNFYDAIYSPVILIANAVVTAAIMILAATGNIRIQNFFGMSVGTAVAVIAYISQVFTPLESIGMEIQTIQSAAAGVHRIDEFLKQDERKQNVAKSEEMDSLDEGQNAERKSEEICIELADVTFAYSDGNKVLRQLSFSVKKGEQVTLTGRTGAGKSTIFKLLLGLYEPQQGTVKINGRDAASIPDAEKRKLFGYVEQNFYQVPGTVLDQITLFDETISRQQAECAAKLAGLHETICELEQGYDTPCSPSIFSQGQWQLLAIARAVAAEPEILLLDEITANLDSDTEQMVLRALRDAAENRTVLSISHRLYQSGYLSSRNIEIE